METKNEQSVGQTHEQGQSQGVAAVASGSAAQRALSLEAAILWGEGDESIEVSLGVAAAMEPTEDEGAAAARLLAAEVRRLRAAIIGVHQWYVREGSVGGCSEMIDEHVMPFISLPNYQGQTLSANNQHDKSGEKS